MIQATDLKAGITFLVNGEPYRVIKYNLIKMGRGGATVRVSARNLLTGAVVDKTFSSNAKVEEVTTTKKKLDFLYSDGKMAFFMNPVTFEQVELTVELIKEQLTFIKEGSEVDILFWGDKPLLIDIPPKVILKVVKTAPGVKGNSAANVFKAAELENGLEVKVPLFINEGDSVRVDTRTGEYIERAKEDKNNF